MANITNWVPNYNNRVPNYFAFKRGRSYTQSMDTEAPKKRGPKTAWAPELGKGEKKPPRVPLPIIELLSESEVKRLLSRMALDPEFKKQVLALL